MARTKELVTRDADEPSARSDGAGNRRWLIGIGITLVFGIFSAVMAWLSYAARTKDATPPQRPSAPAAADPAPASPTGNPSPHGHGKGHGKE